MNIKAMRSNLILLLTALIWGFAFTAQRVGSKYIGAFTFNGIRFILGGISLLPLILFIDKKSSSNKKPFPIVPGIITGIVLFLGSTLQQIGLSYTTAGKASFITGLYMVLVPIIGIFLKHKISKNSWFGVFIAVIGLYLLSINENLTIGYGDLLELIGSFFFAIHILTIDYFSKRFDAIKLSCIQFASCGALSLISALVFEHISVVNIFHASLAILYGGILSVGVAYTLQAVGQKYAKPSHAAIILSMESVFGAIGGALFLGEVMTIKATLGCILILAGILISQINFSPSQSSSKNM